MSPNRIRLISGNSGYLAEVVEFAIFFLVMKRRSEESQTPCVYCGRLSLLPM